MIFIYTCKANLKLAMQLYDMLWNIHEKKFIVYGDDIEKDYEFRDNYLVLNVGDYYEDLTQKTKKMFQVAEKEFPGEPVLKMDDDILPIASILQNHLEKLKGIPYAGCCCYSNEHESFHHEDKVKNKEYNKPMIVPSTNSSAGPMYYLSAEAVHLLNQSDYSFFYEDVTVGYSLNRAHISPTYMKLYDDENINYTYHDHSNHTKLYVRLHGGLGNQLFQVASGYGIAKKHNHILILVSDYWSDSFPHQTDMNEYNKTLFSSFRIIHYKHLPDIPHFYAMDSVLCFQYMEELGKKAPLYIEGYLQTEKYFKEYRKDILDLFKPYDLNLDSYFIHVRRTDIVDVPMYKLDYDDYYKRAIEYIESKTPNSHYYIISDDIPFCKQYALFDSLKTTFVEDTVMNSLSIMASCKGGICCNSSFSWWGSYLIDREKIVILPKKWINNGHENLDVYYEGTIIL